MNDSLELLQQLLRVDSTNPPGNEGPAAEVLEGFLGSSGIETKVLTSPGGRPNLVAWIEGPRDAAPLVLLSHTDVVGVEEENWSHDPFGGEIDQGYVWGRGALDMKGIAAMHAAAIAALASSGAASKRTVLLVAVADEEAGGDEGAGWLVKEHPREVGLGDRPPEVLGEGGYGLAGVIDRPVIPIVLGEKSALWLTLRARGEPGHGALPPARQAVRDLIGVLEQISGRRNTRVHPVMREQFAALAKHAGGPRRAIFAALASPAGRPIAKALDAQLQKAGAVAQIMVDTVTPTEIRAGYKHNVVPGEAEASLDCRLLPDVDIDEFIEGVRKIASERDVAVDVAGRNFSPVGERTPLFDILVEASAGLDGGGSAPVPVASLTPAMTDIRFFRSRGAGGYGWVPLVLDQELLATIHGHDERIRVADFERATEVMAEVVRRAAT